MRETNPALLRLWRNGELESLHRGAWALVDEHGHLLDAVGDPDQPIFPRSATKSLQALTLLESGAADRFGFEPTNIALALASHDGEDVHVEVASDGLTKIGLDADALLCGPQRPANTGVEVAERRITNNCSGKHVGFLAVARRLGVDPARYLEPDEKVQQLVATTVAAMCDVAPESLGWAIDGCSAPTFRLPIRSLALGLARVANPAELSSERRSACERITAAARAHPVLVAGSRRRFCTELLRATDGRVFGKVGAEGVYTLGVIGAGVGLACKIDDGNERAVYPVVIDVLSRRGLLSAAEVEALSFWASPIRRNWDGLEVGRTEVVGGEVVGGEVVGGEASS